MKKLVYHFYILKEWRDNILYKVHLNCLEYYRDCFDEAYFVLSLEDPSDLDSLNEIKNRLTRIFNNIKKITFEVRKNTVYRESETFKRLVVDRLGEDDLVFFGHAQGITNVYWNDVNETCKRVCGLYYFSFNTEKNERAVSKHLLGGLDTISYGSYLFKFTYNTHVKNKYEWHYAGTFFWINSKRLKQYIDNNHVKIPFYCDRYYDEDFLGNIYPMYDGIEDNREQGFMLAASYRQRYYYCNIPNFPNIFGLLDFLISGKEDEFYNFVETMKQK